MPTTTAMVRQGRVETGDGGAILRRTGALVRAKGLDAVFAVLRVAMRISSEAYATHSGNKSSKSHEIGAESAYMCLA